jgi:hypothetical protein
MVSPYDEGEALGLADGEAEGDNEGLADPTCCTLARISVKSEMQVVIDSLKFSRSSVFRALLMFLAP